MTPTTRPSSRPAPRPAVPRADLGIALPPRWHRRRDPARGVVVSARSALVPHSGVPPEITLRCVAVGPDDDLTSWRADVLDEAAGHLVDFALEDEDEIDLLGHDVAYRRFAHRLGLADVICDQWAWLVPDDRAADPGRQVGITLTCAVAREDYADYCDLFEAVAETVEVTPEAA